MAAPRALSPTASAGLDGTDPAQNPAYGSIIARRYADAMARRRPWEDLWRDCYDHALPNHAGFNEQGSDRSLRRAERLYDGTAADAVDQLAASLLAHLAPPWSRWIDLAPAQGLDPSMRRRLTAPLQEASAELQRQIDRSNFVMEAHQAFLDLVTGGVGCLLVEQGPSDAASALRFSAIPLAELALEEGAEGRIDALFRRHRLTAAELIERFPQASASPAWPHATLARGLADPGQRLCVIEAALRQERGHGWQWSVMLEEASAPMPLAQGRFDDMPFIAFRWSKAPGETYGRSPVMRALPDIRTANKVVELVLKNASIAVTGIWQADDDGVLNPAAIQLLPGTIIPKAVGSAGLTPLASPGRFDISQIVLDDLRARIRHALLIDRLGPVQGARMTATEVTERAAEMARLLGAVFGRLQSELLLPLARRSLLLLARRGLIHEAAASARMTEVRIIAPLARAQAQRDAQTTLRWLESVVALGPEAMAVVDLPACARFLAEATGTPPGLLRPVADTQVHPEERQEAAIGATGQEPVIEVGGRYA
jgi:Bacteriophage head to tail connecting protein